MLSLKEKIKLLMLATGSKNLQQLAKKIGISCPTLSRIKNGFTQTSTESLLKIITFSEQYLKNNRIVPNDFFPDLSISSDKSNNNNQNLNVKNTTPSVSSDDKQIDVVEAAETQSSEPSEVAKSKVGGK